MSQVKPKKQKKRHEFKITKDLITKTVAPRTSLTKSQVSECFDVTWDVIEQLLLQPNAPVYFEFIMGNLGKLTIKPHSGRKAGVYKRPDGFGKGESIEEVLDEEEPSYQNLAFEMYPSFKEAFRIASRERSPRQLWFRTEKVGVDEKGKPIKKMFRYKGWLARNGEYTPIETLGTEEVE